MGSVLYVNILLPINCPSFYQQFHGSSCLLLFLNEFTIIMTSSNNVLLLYWDWFKCNITMKTDIFIIFCFFVYGCDRSFHLMNSFFWVLWECFIYFFQVCFQYFLLSYLYVFYFYFYHKLSFLFHYTYIYIYIWLLFVYVYIFIRLLILYTNFTIFYSDLIFNERRFFFNCSSFQNFYTSNIICSKCLDKLFQYNVKNLGK